MQRRLPISLLLLLLQLQLILLVNSSAQLRANIVADYADKYPQNELIDDIFSNSDDVQSFISKLSELRGQWPFKDNSTCSKMKTLDHGYHRHKKRGSNKEMIRELLQRVPRCGVTAMASVNRELDERQSSVDNGSSRHLSRTERETKNRDTEELEQDQTERRLEVDILQLLTDASWIGNTDVEVENDPNRINTHSTRIVGGHLSRPGAWPWLAAVGRKVSGPKCGGTLISDRWVITAAHCFENEEMPCTYNVRLGSRSWFYDEEGTHVDTTVEAIYRHPDYDAENHFNDIALLKLSVAVELNEKSNINAICLPPHSRSAEPGTVCVAAGWGRTAEGSKASVYESREVKLPVISYDTKCGKYEKGRIQRGMLCAGYLEGGRDTCQGDSGGPLMYQRDDQRWTLLGLTSFGEGCARANYPGVYTDIGYHLHWIASVIDRF